MIMLKCLMFHERIEPIVNTGLIQQPYMGCVVLTVFHHERNSLVHAPAKYLI